MTCHDNLFDDSKGIMTFKDSHSIVGKAIMTFRDGLSVVGEGIMTFLDAFTTTGSRHAETCMARSHVGTGWMGVPMPRVVKGTRYVWIAGGRVVDGEGQSRVGMARLDGGQRYLASSVWLAAKTSRCRELPWLSIVTTAGKSRTSNSQIASGAPNSCMK